MAYPSTILANTDPAGTSLLTSPSHSAQHTTVNDDLTAVETKIGLGAGTPTAANMLLVATGNGTSVWGGTVNSATFGTPSITGGTVNSATLTSPVLQGNIDGWTNANEAWTYATASTITVPTGAASKYQIGDKIKWTQTTVKYGVITAVADTVLTIAVNLDYVVTNAAITLNYYSHEANPIGFPSLFSFTSTITGFTTATTTLYYSILGRIAHIIMYNFGATSNAVSFICTQPFTPIALGSQSYYYQSGYGVLNNAAWVTTSGVSGVAIATGNINFGLDASTFAGNAFGGFVATGTKTVQGVVVIPF